ncbi:hypothetical protein CANCADRAFT_54982 [Tortispora caseinolytica NRRL Y-17796]|uniref:NADH:flavin oxidoreductase/NADH oxidase N-terminal domain-containing protein n=1 Tax=Tortispora caseinolytica NRRL Y-17796 TaxID=767744 RepID=A0A1E4TDP4_9ASCO|nr:hypothetical protein CANCADRAFT_54982 [Tortispora caseinolytica NRRL Y-17796]
MVFNKPKSYTPLVSKPQPGISFFSPAQIPPAGTAAGYADPAKRGSPLPKAFQPLSIRNLHFQNRIWLSPMCQYSAGRDGTPTQYHVSWLGSVATRGTALIMVEATAVSPEGRISPHDLGIYSQDNLLGHKKIVEFVHSQNQKVGIQLAHAGRKGSTLPPWLVDRMNYPEKLGEEGGFTSQLVSASAIPFDDLYPTPTALDKAGIQRIIDSFKQGARYAIEAGYDVIELHFAHGYLVTQFLSPNTNKRTDEYGGSFENRARLPLEIIRAVRDVIEEAGKWDDIALFARVSATEYLDHLPESWKLDDTIKLAKLFKDEKIDLLDVSSGGNSPNQTFPAGFTPSYQTLLAGKIKKAVEGLLIGAVGGIRSTVEVDRALEEEDLDSVFVGRSLLRDPQWTLQLAEDYGLVVKWPHQYHRAHRVKI